MNTTFLNVKSFSEKDIDALDALFEKWRENSFDQPIIISVDTKEMNFTLFNGNVNIYVQLANTNFSPSQLIFNIDNETISAKRNDVFIEQSNHAALPLGKVELWDLYRTESDQRSKMLGLLLRSSEKFYFPEKNSITIAEDGKFKEILCQNVNELINITNAYKAKYKAEEISLSNAIDLQGVENTLNSHPEIEDK